MVSALLFASHKLFLSSVFGESSHCMGGKESWLSEVSSVGKGWGEYS